MRLILFLLTIIGVGCQPAEKKDTQLNISKVDSIQTLTAALQKDPQNPVLLARRAEAYYLKGDSAATLADIEKAIFYAPKEAHLHYLKGFFLYQFKDHPKAKLALEESISLNVDNPEPFFLLGNVFMLLNEFNLAHKNYDLALSKKPDEPAYLFAKGYLFRTQKQYQNAIISCNKALKVDSNYIKALWLLHDIYLEDLKDEKKALVYNQRILKAEPGHPLGMYNKGYEQFRIYQSLEKTDPVKANQALRKAIEGYTLALKPNPTFAAALYQRGYCLFLLKEYDLAVKDFESTLKLNPYDEKAYFMLGSIYEGFQDYSRAYEYYLQASKLNPNFAGVKEALQTVSSKR